MMKTMSVTGRQVQIKLIKTYHRLFSMPTHPRTIVAIADMAALLSRRSGGSPRSGDQLPGQPHFWVIRFQK
ncbi:MAG: hypothetical protein GY743_09080 [Planctomycetaceae bacterium]|nr:hypothetical protein [Planctomycetaceae bacterium]